MDSQIQSLTEERDQAIRDCKLAEDAQCTENQNRDQQIRQLQSKNQELVQLLALRTSPLPSPKPQVRTITNGYAPSESSTLVPQDTIASGNKKKKKKKKKTVAATESAEPALSPTLEQEEKAVDTYPRRLLEDYLAQLSKSLDSGNLEGLGTASSQLSNGTEVWQESVAHGVNPGQLSEIKATAERLSKDKEIDVQIEALDSKLSGFAGRFSTLTGQLEEARSTQQSLKMKLQETENELKVVREQEERLQSKNRKLETTAEDVEEIRDMLRDVGNELVEAKDKIKELGARETTVLTEKTELEATIARLTTELEETRQSGKFIDDMQSQVSSAETLAAVRLTELDEANKKLASVETELLLLKSELATASADKNDLATKSADFLTKLRQVERSEKEARETNFNLQNTISAKEKEINKLRSDLTEIQNVKFELEKSLRSTKATLIRVESERNELIQREQYALNDAAKLKRETELYRERIASLESRRTALTSERDALAQEAQTKSAHLESVQTTMHSLREQTTEMGHRAREAKDRCEALEEELSEAHKLLSERSREAGTMRRLLDEAEGREQGRIKEAREKLEQAIEERDHIEEEITILKRNNVEGSGELTKNLREKEIAVKELTDKYEAARTEVEELRKKNEDVQRKLQHARKEADEATFKLKKLSKSLVSSPVMKLMGRKK